MLSGPVVTTVRGVSMQVHTEPTKLLACKIKELRTTGAVGFGVTKDDLPVIVTARLLNASADTYV